MIFDYQNSEGLAMLQSILGIVSALVLGALLLAVAIEVTRYFLSSDDEQAARRKLFADLKRLALFGVGVVMLALPTMGMSMFSSFSDTEIEDELVASAARGTTVERALTPQTEQWEGTIIDQAAQSAKESAGGAGGITAVTEGELRGRLKGALTSAENVDAQVIEACEAILASNAYLTYGSSITNDDVKADSALVTKLTQYGITDLDDAGIVSSTWLGAGTDIGNLNSSLGIEDFTDPDKSYLDDAWMHSSATH